ncbi:MAG: hypothetical protein AAGE80_18320 [Pseudomonadota bacterium]
MKVEYKTVGAPERCKRRKGAKTGSERAAAAIEEILQAEATDGWAYLRTDLIPVEERTGWFGGVREVHRAVLVFQRVLEPEVRTAPSYRPPSEREATDKAAPSPTRIPMAPPLHEEASAGQAEKTPAAMPTTRAEPAISAPPAPPTRPTPAPEPKVEPAPSSASAENPPAQSAQDEKTMQPAMKITRAMGMTPDSMKSGKPPAKG